MENVANWLEAVNAARGFGEGHPNRIDMRKSELLGRLSQGQAVRTRKCPTHKGTMWCSNGGVGDWTCCDGTGWLRNEKDKP